MSTFENPVKHYVINDPSQITLQFQDPSGAPVTVFSTPDHKVFLTPIFTNVKRSEVKIRNKTLPVAGTAQVGTLTFTSGATAGDNIRIRVVMDDTMNVTANISEVSPMSDVYVVDFVAQSTLTSAQLATALYNLLNRPDFPFAVTVAGSVITFTANHAGVPFSVYIRGNNATFSVTIPYVFPVGTYNALLNVYPYSQFDSTFPYGDKLNRPLPGRQYITYYWEIEAVEKVGGHSGAGLTAVRRTRFMVYLDSTLTTLETELDKIIP